MPLLSFYLTAIYMYLHFSFWFVDWSHLLLMLAPQLTGWKLAFAKLYVCLNLTYISSICWSYTNRQKIFLYIYLFLHMQKDCFEVYALVPGLLREEVCPLCNFLYLSWIAILQSPHYLHSKNEKGAAFVCLVLLFFNDPFLLGRMAHPFIFLISWLKLDSWVEKSSSYSSHKSNDKNENANKFCSHKFCRYCLVQFWSFLNQIGRCLLYM